MRTWTDWSHCLCLCFECDSNHGKLKGYDGYLGGIVSVVPVDDADDTKQVEGTASDTSDQQRYKYDIDLELGDTLHGIDRSDLHYTTEESRSRRKRKPNSIIEANNAIDGKRE